MNTPVNFELAKLLKEKDFDELGDMYYTPITGILMEHYGIKEKNTTYIHQEISAPTIAEVVMWLYDKHGIWIWIRPYKDHASDNNEPYYAQMNVWKMGVTVSKEFKTPTEAYQEAIKYTLNNLI